MSYNKHWMDAKELGLVFASLGGQKKDDMRPQEYDGAVKTTPDGRPVYRTGLKALRLSPEGEIGGEAFDVRSVSIVEPTDLESLTHYVPTGKALVTHYEDGRSRRHVVSIVLESLAPMQRAGSDK